jgi:ribosomal protein L44E
MEYNKMDNNNNNNYKNNMITYTCNVCGTDSERRFMEAQYNGAGVSFRYCPRCRHYTVHSVGIEYACNSSGEIKNEK